VTDDDRQTEDDNHTISSAITYQVRSAENMTVLVYKHVIISDCILHTFINHRHTYAQTDDLLLSDIAIILSDHTNKALDTRTDIWCKSVNICMHVSGMQISIATQLFK